MNLRFPSSQPVCLCLPEGFLLRLIDRDLGFVEREGRRLIRGAILSGRCVAPPNDGALLEAVRVHHIPFLLDPDTAVLVEVDAANERAAWLRAMPAAATLPITPAALDDDGALETFACGGLHAARCGRALGRLLCDLRAERPMAQHQPSPPRGERQDRRWPADLRLARALARGAPRPRPGPPCGRRLPRDDVRRPNASPVCSPPQPPRTTPTRSSTPFARSAPTARASSSTRLALWAPPRCRLARTPSAAAARTIAPCRAS